jgi:hypothetical protein
MIGSVVIPIVVFTSQAHGLNAMGIRVWRNCLFAVAMQHARNIIEWQPARVMAAMMPPTR